MHAGLVFHLKVERSAAGDLLWGLEILRGNREDAGSAPPRPPQWSFLDKLSVALERLGMAVIIFREQDVGSEGECGTCFTVPRPA